jgi:ATP-dependent Clp protease ATP-binding subunit ClpA
MYERFTDRARKVMQLANQEAKNHRHEYIGTEHILLGLVKEGSGVAANVLKNLDIDLGKVRLEVEKIVLGGPDMVAMEKLPQTPRAKKVVEFAIEEARNLNHNYVGTEHLLLGLVREQEGVAAQVLMNLGLKLEDVREEVLNLLGTAAPLKEGHSPLPKIPLVLDENTAYTNLPQEVLQALREINDHIGKLVQEKEEAVTRHDFGKAAALVETVRALKQRLVVATEALKRQVLGPDDERR